MVGRSQACNVATLVAADRAGDGLWREVGPVGMTVSEGRAKFSPIRRGGLDRHRGTTCFEGVRRPALRPGQVVVLDNLSAHHNKEARALVEAAGCQLVHLPAYSPDLNPIEKAFSKVKSALRKLARRTVPQLLEAIPKVLADVTAKDAIGYIGRSGYATT